MAAQGEFTLLSIISNVADGEAIAKGEEWVGLSSEFSTPYSAQTSTRLPKLRPLSLSKRGAQERWQR